MKATILLSALSALMLIAQSSSAQTIIHYDFENGSTTGWAVHSSQSHPYLSVVTDPVRGVSNQVLKVDASYGGLDMLRTSLPETLTTGTYVMKLQIMVSGSGGGASDPQYSFDRRISFLEKSSDVSTTSTYTRFRQVGDSNELNSYSGTAAGGSAKWDGARPMISDQWYQITQTINLDDLTWSWSVENLTTGGVPYTSEPLGC